MYIKAYSLSHVSSRGLHLLFCLIMLLPVLRAQKIGINNKQPTGLLSLNDAIGKRISLWGDANVAHYGMGSNTFGDWLMFSDASFTSTVFGLGSSNNFTEFMRLASSGNLGIGITNPSYPVDVLGRIRLTTDIRAEYDPVNQTYSYDYRPSFIYLNAQNNASILARIGVNNGQFGIYRQSDNRLLFGLNPAGALVVNSTTGQSGQVLMSNGFTAPPTWEPDLAADLYAGQYFGYQSTIAYLLSDGSDGTLSFATSPTIYGTEPPLVVGVSSPCKMLVKFEVLASVDCCSPGNFQMNVLDNDQVKRTFRYSVTPEQTETITGAVLIDTSPGVHSYGLQVIKLSGPSIRFDVNGVNGYHSTISVTRVSGKIY